MCLREDDKDTSYRFTLTIEKFGCEAITRSIEIVGNEGGTISVNCNNLSEIQDIYIKIESLSNKSTECNMTHDFAKILASEESSDVTLVTGDGTEFKAHTFVLSARSVAEVMKEMLNYLYTDRKIPNQMAAPLYTAANKYALLHLQDMCEQALIETMDVASVADTLRFADLHGNERLKTKAITFIARNIKTVTDTESWKNLRQTDHQLCMDVLEEVAKQHF
uniref:BTB/POZ domain protein n=1 Tax=Musca domestica TaxID=7370 RepID=T1PG99_MUSDO